MWAFRLNFAYWNAWASHTCASMGKRMFKHATSECKSFRLSSTTAAGYTEFLHLFSLFILASYILHRKSRTKSAFLHHSKTRLHAPDHQSGWLWPEFDLSWSRHYSGSCMESCCRYAGGRSCTSYRSREGGEDLSLDHEWFDRGAPVMKLKIYHHHIIFGVDSRSNNFNWRLQVWFGNTSMTDLIWSQLKSPVLGRPRKCCIATTFCFGVCVNVGRTRASGFDSFALGPKRCVFCLDASSTMFLEIFSRTKCSGCKSSKWAWPRQHWRPNNNKGATAPVKLIDESV